MRRRLAATVAAATLVAPIVVPVTAADAAPKRCATKAEYQRVRTNATMTPATVQGVLGVRGKITAQRVIVNAWSGQITAVYAIRYPACKKHHSVAVYFAANSTTTAVAVRKVWN